MAFVAPKIIGGGGGGGGGGSGGSGTGFGAYAGRAAPTPVGDLGLYEMTQALPVEPAAAYSPGLLEGADFWQPAAAWEPVGPDVLFTGYLPTAGGGPPALDAAAAAAASAAGASPASAAPARAAPLRAWPAGARSSLAGFRECKLPRAAEVNLSSRKSSTASSSLSSSSCAALLSRPGPRRLLQELGRARRALQFLSPPDRGSDGARERRRRRRRKQRRRRRATNKSRRTIL